MNRSAPRPDALARWTAFFGGVLGVFRELYDGARTRSLPVGPLLLTAASFQLAVLVHFDRWLFGRVSVLWLYPRNLSAFVLYYLTILVAPFLGWAIVRSLKRRNLIERLNGVFQASGLKNNLGNTPRFLFDRPLDSVTRKLRVTGAVLPLQAFQKTKPAIESGLQIFIDDFREVRKLGAVDIIYAQEPMPTLYKFDRSVERKSSEYCIGVTRSKPVIESLDDVPHLLVAGQTGGGKSTFLRQFITSLYLAKEKMNFLLIDLKGGLEFQLFEGLSRVEVPMDMGKAIQSLSRISKEVERRMALLKEHRCKDLREYRRRRCQEGGSKAPFLERFIIVVDEAAEMFLAGQHATGASVQQARKVMSQVARQGRSLGIHLVIATQRPDSRALDPQVKANLPGVLCFQMVNDISSITVLGNGRATNLPPVAGRAIWKCGADFVEVQTPFMTPQEAEELLKGERREAVATTSDATSNRKESR